MRTNLKLLTVFLLRARDWEVKSCVQSLNLLMYPLCQKCRSDLALQMFQQMDFQGFYRIGTIMLSLNLLICCSVRPWQGLEIFTFWGFSDFRQLSLDPNTVLYWCISDTLFRMMLEPVLPMISLLGSENEVLLKEVLYNAVMMIEYSSLILKQECHYMPTA